MKEFVDYVLSGMTGKVSGEAMDTLAALLSAGDVVHRKAIATLLAKTQKTSYSDGYGAGYKAGHTEGWTEGEESGFYEAQHQMRQQGIL